MIAAAAAVTKSYERGRTPIGRHEGEPVSTQDVKRPPPTDPPVPKERDTLIAPVVRHEGGPVLYGHLGAGLALSGGPLLRPSAPSELTSLAKITSGNTANATAASGVTKVVSLRTTTAPVAIASQLAHSSTTYCVPSQPYYRI